MRDASLSAADTAGDAVDATHRRSEGPRGNENLYHFGITSLRKVMIDKCCRVSAWQWHWCAEIQARWRELGAGRVGALGRKHLTRKQREVGHLREIDLVPRHAHRAWQQLAFQQDDSHEY